MSGGELKRAALVIGINYENVSDARLRGCENDAKHLKQFLQSHDFPEENISLLCEPSTTTKQSIVQSVCDLISESWQKDLDEIFFSISCHGAQVRDFNHDEIDGKDECVLPCDFKVSGIIRDDLFSNLFSKANPKTKVVCLIDACHSGSMIDLPFNYCYQRENDKVVMTKIKDDDSNSNNKIMCISGCLDTQTSADAYNVNNMHQFSGAMTSCFIESFGQLENEKENENEKVPVLHLFRSLHERLEQRNFKQRPVLSSSFLVNENETLLSA